MIQSSSSNVYTQRILITILIMEFCLGLIELYLLNKNNNISDGCEQIWNLIAIACAIDIYVPLISCYIKCCWDYSNEKTKTIVYMHLLQLIPTIWSTITYLDVKSICYSYWKEEFSDLWSLVLIHVTLIWLVLGFIGLSIIMACLWCCCKYFSYSSHSDESFV